MAAFDYNAFRKRLRVSQIIKNEIIIPNLMNQSSMVPNIKLTVLAFSQFLISSPSLQHSFSKGLMDVDSLSSDLQCRSTVNHDYILCMIAVYRSLYSGRPLYVLEEQILLLLRIFAKNFLLKSLKKVKASTNRKGWSPLYWYP